jgi:cell division protein FtsA
MHDDMLFTGIDIGSTAVRIAVGQRIQNGDREQVHILGAAEVPAEGIHRGAINSIEDAVSSVSACIEKVERMTGAPVGSAWVSIPGNNVVSIESKGIIIVSRTDGEIREEDVERAVDNAQALASPVNSEIIHVIPKTFIVDGQRGIKDPVGMNGIRLEVDTRIIQGPASHIKNLTKCVYRTGANIEHLVLGILATAEATLSARQKELGVAVLNIGGASTDLAVYEQGDIIHLASLPIGAELFTGDIAIGLRTNIDVAERVKLNYATVASKDIDRRVEVNLLDLGADEDERVSLHFVSKIVQARGEELFERVDKELKKIGKSGMLPAGVVLTGGGAKLSGMVDLAKQKLRLPASLGQAVAVSSITDRVGDLAFTTAIGLVQWGINETPDAPRKRNGFLSRVAPVTKVKDGIRKLFGSFAK